MTERRPLTKGPLAKGSLAKGVTGQRATFGFGFGGFGGLLQVPHCRAATSPVLRDPVVHKKHIEVRGHHSDFYTKQGGTLYINLREVGMYRYAIQGMAGGGPLARGWEASLQLQGASSCQNA